MYNEIVNSYGDRVRTHLVEVQIADLSGKYFLPDDSILRNKKIIGVFSRLNTAGDVYSPDTNRPAIGDVAMRSAFLTLSYDNKNIIINHPLEDLVITSADRSQRKFVINELTPSKSYVLIANPTTPGGKIAVDQSILLHFIYVDEK